MHVVHQSAVDFAFLHHAAKSSEIYLVELSDPHAFVANLPFDFRPPTQKAPRAGLPSNVWVGCTLQLWHYGNLRAELRRADDLFDVRARIRWLRFEGPAESFDFSRVAYLFDAWRCSNCGRRGRDSRRLCPHSRVLCGDARLDPQIHWLRSNGVTLPKHFLSAARHRGVVIEPDVPEVKELTSAAAVTG